MIRFEVGKKYKASHSPFTFTCLAVFEDVPVLKGEQEGSKPWTPFFPEYYKEYVEPKPPIIVERWVNYVQYHNGRITTNIFNDVHTANEAFNKLAELHRTDPIRYAKPVKQTHLKEQFDAV